MLKNDKGTVNVHENTILKIAMEAINYYLYHIILHVFIDECPVGNSSGMVSLCESILQVCSGWCIQKVRF